MLATTENHDTNTVARIKKPWYKLATNIAIILAAPIVAILLTVFVFQSYQVDGVSMQNTLQNNDRLIIWKLPRTWARITGHQYVPKRGDIIIFTQSDLSMCGQDGKQLVKRVIGLPGDHVVFKHGQYTIYNAQHPQGFQPDKTLPYGKTNTALLNDPTTSSVDVTLNHSQLFVSGDHRADSCDSRSFGPIQTNTVIGKLALRLLPFSKAERF